MPINGASNDDGGVRKMSFMVKRSQGKSSFGAINFKKRVFVLTDSKLTYYDGTMEVSCLTIVYKIFFCLCANLLEYSVCYYRNEAARRE